MKGRISHTTVMALTLSLLFVSPGYAGDPCPIAFTLSELGVKPGLSRESVLDGLKSRAKWIGMSYRGDAGRVGVTAVFEGSPAEMAGIVVGDVVLSIGGQAIATSADVDRALETYGPGELVQVVVLRGDTEATLSVDVGRRDPVVVALARYIRNAECTEFSQTPVPKDVAKLMIDRSGELRCRDAHRALAASDQAYGDGMLFVIRDESRILFSHAGHSTFCIKSSELDGERLTDRNVGGVFKRLAAAYIRARHSSP